jgi:hypothetical protein
MPKGKTMPPRVAPEITDTGIYLNISLPDMFMFAANDYDYARHLETYLAGAEAVAKSVFKQSVEDTDFDGGDDFQVNDAANVLRYIQRVRSFTAAGNATAAAACGIELSKVFDCLQIRHYGHEAQAQRGKHVDAGARKSRAKRAAKADALHDSIHRLVDEKLQKRGRQSLTAIRERVAEQLGVSPATVLRATKDLSKK